MPDEQTTVAKFTKANVRATIVCMPWHAREFGSEFTRATECFACGRDVAAPTQDCRPLCIYCALDRGSIEPVEQEPREWRQS